MASWERLEHEPQKAYGYFMAYRSLGLGRSLTGLLQAIRDNTVLLPEKNLSTLKRYFAQFDWQSRAKAWDDFQAELRLEIEIIESARHHREQSSQFRDTFNHLGKKQVALGNKMLSESERLLPISPSESCALAKAATTLIGMPGADAWAKSLAIDKLLEEYGID
ncbi:hypothetical protein RIF25_09245 [Thermosynechococcaceae cyanobacterium BACA0444]|uniref:Uncharacterized protein n=1 Tax=Pseudocalidococcus azoricus BACA0444 TaxID=2918990 RepID=A0AAE4FSI7_9CYAN|nr:hypothetical protein [Pseudocalidococcus azoricus]MDS3860993.1 hypothetical protein [Pseudocalidococcus azoricus BACA0444]